MEAIKINKKISIIVPIYNVEQYLEKCVASLLNQTYKNIEILLVDDGSTDNCGMICDDLVKTDNRIKVFHKENGGYGSVLEYAIDIIDTEYFLICDSDDWLKNNAVEKLLNAMVENNVDLVVARKTMIYIDERSESDEKDFNNLKENIIYDNLCSFLNIPPSPHAKLYKTKFCKDIKFPKKINNTDFLLYQVYLTKINKALYLNEPLANYFIDRPGNSFNEDCVLTEKSCKSNSIVTKETFFQLNQKSKLYIMSNLNLFYRSCYYLILMKKNNMSNDEYEKNFTYIIDSSKKYKKYLFKYFYFSTKSKIKVFLRYLIYVNFFNVFTRKLLILMLSKRNK